MADVTFTIRSILANHGVNTEVEIDGWLSTGGTYPASRAYTNEPRFRGDGCHLRLDVEVALSADRVIVESFSDFGRDVIMAYQSSLQNFCTGSLHVLLSGLWDVSDQDQVLVEDFNCGDRNWRLHIGNLVRKAAGGVDVPPPTDLMPIFDGLLQHARLAPVIHWGRLYYANMPNMENIVEVLLDNVPWPLGESAVRGAAWPDLSSFYSARMFWIMVPRNLAA